jgi:hypothetical protein
MIFAFKLLFIVLLPVITILGVIAVVVSAIVYVICLIVAVFSPSLKAKDCKKYSPGQVIEIYKETLDFIKGITGCGRYHPSPYVRNYIDHICRIAGCTWESSIFTPTSSYYNTIYLYAPSEKGRNDDKDNLIIDNIPNKTGIDFLNELCEVFNADYWITNGKLKLERYDTFYLENNIWIDIANLGDRLVENVCYSWSNGNKYAGAIIKYTEDATDEIGNEALKNHLYKEIIDWNTPMKAGQKGLKKVTIPFGALRVRDDGIDDDILTELFEALQYKSNIILYKDKTSIPKLIITDGNIKHAKPVKFNGQYNRPYYIDENDAAGTLYKYHQIDNPRLGYVKKYDFSFTFEYTCGELIEFMQNNGFLKQVNLLKGGVTEKGIVEELEVNFKQKTIQVKGTV